MNEFSKRLKELRTERNLTQAEVANALGVTTQAVSKWESQASLPDIAMLLPIADFYGVTADYLLGHDVTKKEQEIRDYLKRHNRCDYSGKEQWEEAIVETRSMLRKHPKDYRIMLKLTFELYYYYIKCSQESKYLMELLEWGNTIVSQCVDSAIRYMAIDVVFAAYGKLEMYDKMKELVDTLPTISYAKETFFRFCFPDNTKERLCAEQWWGYKCLQELCSSMLNYGENVESKLCTNKDKLVACQTVGLIIRAYYTHGDYDWVALAYLCHAELYSALYVAKESDTQQAMAFLRKAEMVLEGVDTVTQTHTSPLLSEITSPDTGTKGEFQEFFRMVLKNDAFDTIREEAAFKEMEQRIFGK